MPRLRHPLRISLVHQEQFTLYVRACELHEMLNDLSVPAFERIAIAPDFFRCVRKLRDHGLNFWKFGASCVD